MNDISLLDTVKRTTGSSRVRSIYLSIYIYLNLNLNL